jgi:hypothetical protein
MGPRRVPFDEGVHTRGEGGNPDSQEEIPWNSILEFWYLKFQWNMMHHNPPGKFKI